MDNYLSDECQGPELELGLNVSSPLMLSPTNESSNPFFSFTTGDFSQALIFDAAMNNQLEAKHRLTPQEFPFTVDYFDKDYFSMAASIKRQRVGQHPTRSSSSSLASSASSATPSEADSDLLERGMSEEDSTTMLQLDSFSAYPFGDQPSTLTGSIGLGFGLKYDPLSQADLNHSKSSLTMKAEYSQDGAERQYYQHQQQQTQQHHEQQQSNPAPTHQSHASVTLNTFNLSDFISDQEQEQQQQQPQVTNEGRANMFMTPNRPIAHRDVSRLMVRSNSYSPASSQASGVESNNNNILKPSLLEDGAQRGYDLATGERTVESHGLFTDRGPHGYLFERPGMPMRSFSDTVETLSCNPAHITPSHERQSSDQTSVEGNNNNSGYFFSSPNIGQIEVAQKLFGRDMSCPSPLSQFSSPAQSHYSLFNSAGEEHRGGDVFDETSSPSLFQDSRPMMLSYSAPSIRPQQQRRESHHHQLGSDARVSGVMRNGRSAAIAASHNSSPYQSPALDLHHFDNNTGRQMKIEGHMVQGIITKRSRGRRVPNNPEELNNLGKSGKVYTCKVPGCGKCFKRSEHLKRHVRSIHTDEKPYTCHCGKTFSRHDNLNQHARVHAPGGLDSPMSQELSLSRSGSPMSLPSAFAAAHLDSKNTTFNLVNSRLRQAVNQDEGEDDQSLDDEDQSEAEIFAMEREDRRALRH